MRTLTALSLTTLLTMTAACGQSPQERAAALLEAAAECLDENRDNDNALDECDPTTDEPEVDRIIEAVMETHFAPAFLDLGLRVMLEGADQDEAADELIEALMRTAEAAREFEAD